MNRLLLRFVLATSFTVFAAFHYAALASAKELRIAMMLWRGETEAEKGFRDGLKALDYSVHYSVMNAIQDRTELGRLMREELKPNLDGFDYVYLFGTTVAMAAKSIVTEKTPQIYNAVADPVGAGIVQNAESSGGNITGVTNEIPLALQMQTALKVISFKRLGLLFNPREKNSMLVREKFTDVATKFHFEVVDLPSPPCLESVYSSPILLTEQNSNLTPRCSSL